MGLRVDSSQPCTARGQLLVIPRAQLLIVTMETRHHYGNYFVKSWEQTCHKNYKLGTSVNPPGIF